jgi:hypothetical protein
MDYMEVLRVVHLIGLACGVGGGVVADSLMGKAVLGNKIDKSQLETMHHVGSIVTAGLALLILSGVGFLTNYSLAAPELLLNPKLWAKLTIVAIVGLNGLVLHKVILPFLETRVGKPLFAKDVAKQAHTTMTVGAISAVSWYSALILGSWAGLNFIASYGVIFGVYAVVLVGAIVVANLTAWVLTAKSGQPARKKAAVRAATA